MTKSDLIGVRVLVVEDNAFQRRIMIRMLEVLKAAEVRQAADGAEALGVLENYSPDVVVTNCQMQPMGGLEFARRVRASEQRPFQTVPIIMVSATDELTQVEAARNAGINAFLAKPVLIEALREQILHLIENPPRFVRSDAYIGPERRLADVPFPGPDRRRADA